MWMPYEVELHYQAIRTLEGRLGAALLTRTARSVGLTEAGMRSAFANRRRKRASWWRAAGRCTSPSAYERRGAASCSTTVIRPSHVSTS